MMPLRPQPRTQGSRIGAYDPSPPPPCRAPKRRLSLVKRPLVPGSKCPGMGLKPRFPLLSIVSLSIERPPVDALSLNSTPFYDACTHDPMITMMGTLPASFPALLQGIGHPASSADPVTRTVRSSLLAHLKGTWATYLSLCADARDLVRTRKKRASIEEPTNADTNTGPSTFPPPPTGARAPPTSTTPASTKTTEQHPQHTVHPARQTPHEGHRELCRSPEKSTSAPSGAA
jgi:hypothetical protein